MPLVTNTRVSLPPKESLQHRVLKRPVLVDEEKADEEGVRALKKRRRKEAFTFTLIDVSSEGIQNAELLNYQTIRVAREAGEGSSKACTLSLGATAKLIEVGTTSKSYSNRLKALRAFARVVLAKLDMFKITNSQAERSFVFGSNSVVHVRVLFLPLLFLFF